MTSSPRSKRSISADVPRPNILGPRHFILNTYDTPTHSDTYLFAYADDTRASLTLSSARTFWQQLRFRNVEPSRSHFRRTIDNRINMNSLIFQHTVFSTNARHFNRTVITFQDSPISTSDNIKYLGVYIDTRLTWKPRITFLRNRSHTVNRQLWWLMGRHSKLNQALKILICKATIKPT